MLKLCPQFVWEPLPSLCTPQELGRFKEVIRHVDIVSPNAEELGGFFANKPDNQTAIAQKILEWGIGSRGNGFLIVRNGKQGSRAYGKARSLHLRAYYLPDPDFQSKVMDPTGGGNAFLGALAMALKGQVIVSPSEIGRGLEIEQRLLEDPFVQLSLCLIIATVAASFVIEQPGMPILDKICENERWNGEGFRNRLEGYLAREKNHLLQQIQPTCSEAVA